MPDTAWKRATLDEPWYVGETISCGIGQGYVLATPLQLTVMTARIATGKRGRAQLQLLQPASCDAGDFQASPPHICNSSVTA